MPQTDGALGIIVEENVRVPMRDGIALSTNIFRPDAPGKFPAIVNRTPYGKSKGGLERYVRAGYVVLSQDARGRYESEGEYVLYTDESNHDAEDGYDTVEWAAVQPWCDGQVGTWGTSYPAYMQWQLAALRPPHLRCLCACSIPPENTEVDWWGAFKPARRIKWWLSTIAPDLRRRAGWPPPHTTAEAREIFDKLEGATWMGFLPWLEFPKHLPPPLDRYAEDWLKHPNRKCWRFAEKHAEIEVPNLDFSGWYDHCASMMHLAGMQENARSELARTQTKLVLGPWNHGGAGQRKIGEIDFGPAAQLDLDDLKIRWFDHWLKGIANDVEQWPACRYFVMGSGKWKSAPTWPPPDKPQREYYIGSDGTANPVDKSGTLSTQSPAAPGSDTYTYDPRDPVPTLWTPAFFTVPPDRRRLEYRSDILHYRSEPLTEEVEIVGYPEFVLYASSSASDTDFFVRLVDEDPEGMALEVCYGMVRARHRNSLDEEELLTPGEVTEFRIKLGATANRFLKGHRLRVEITSSDFPNHDRNHNTGRNDLADTELVPAQQTIVHSPQHPSRLIVGVDEG